MKEQRIIECIKEIVGDRYIGDDCAYLEDLGIVVTQDSLAENIHFKRKFCSFYQLGYKSAAVNISDILASGAKPAYITIALSIPSDINENDINEFYKGVSAGLYGAKIVGGDITGSKNDFIISVTAIGTTQGRNISSRKNAKPGYFVVVKGNHGSSSAGFRELLNNRTDSELIQAHLEPIPECDFSEFISTNCSIKYAMMDTSDGLADALFKIAESSDVKIVAQYDKIPHLSSVTKNDVLFGGEDYKLVACVPEDIALRSGGEIIGKVLPFDGIRVEISGQKFCKYDDLPLFNHFSN